jgi:hypothetical protein
LSELVLPKCAYYLLEGKSLDSVYFTIPSWRIICVSNCIVSQFSPFEGQTTNISFIYWKGFDSVPLLYMDCRRKKSRFSVFFIIPFEHIICVSNCDHICFFDFKNTFKKKLIFFIFFFTSNFFFVFSDYFDMRILNIIF